MQDHQLPADFNDDLYHGALLTKAQSFLMLHQHFDRFQPSREEMTSMLKLIKMHCPQPNIAFATSYDFDDFLGNGDQFSSLYEYCPCFRIFQMGEQACPDCGESRWREGMGDI